jgi:hypothetical protein
MLKAQPDRLRVESSTDAFVCASWEVWVPAAHRACFWANSKLGVAECCQRPDERFLGERSSRRGHRSERHRSGRVLTLGITRLQK